MHHPSTTVEGEQTPRPLSKDIKIVCCVKSVSIGVSIRTIVPLRDGCLKPSTKDCLPLSEIVAIISSLTTTLYSILFSSDFFCLFSHSSRIVKTFFLRRNGIFQRQLDIFSVNNKQRPPPASRKGGGKGKSDISTVDERLFRPQCRRRDAAAGNFHNHGTTPTTLFTNEPAPSAPSL